VDLPRVRRYRKGAIDRLYVEDAEGITYGWADTATGEIHVQVPASEARIEAALNAWANSYPEEDLAAHPPGRSTEHLAAAWQAEIDALEDDRRTLDDMLSEAIYQRDQYAKGHSGELRIGLRLNALYSRGWGILHAIPLYDGRADIDHILVGSGGVWTVNAKAHGPLDIRVMGDRVTVGRSYVDHVPSARHEANVVSRILTANGFNVRVQGAVAIDQAPGAGLHIIEAPPDVVIDDVEDVVNAIVASEGLIDQDTVNRVFALLRHRSVWESSN